MNAPVDRRFPRAVFARGEEPDPRFSLANERTFLAWIRTGLALMAGGVALRALDPRLGSRPLHGAAILLVVLGILAAVNGWWSWLRTERALRSDQPLPGPGLGSAVTIGVGVVGALLLVALWTG